MPPKQVKKKKGLSLTPEKKKLLKQLIMQKAADEMKKQQERELEEKKIAIEQRVPKLQIDGLDKGALDKKVRELYAIVCRLEEEKYEWESRLGRQCEEISELNIKVNDVKGKFTKPMLKKVAKSTQKMLKFDKEAMAKTKISLGVNLKSTGQSKFALDDKEEPQDKKPDWGVDHLKHKEADENAAAHENDADADEEEAEEEEEEEEEEE